MSCCDGSGQANMKADIDKILSSLPTVVHGYYETGGHQLQGLLMTLPPPDGKHRTYGRPTIHKDGSIEYPPGVGSPPKDINGFYRDKSNPRLFHSLWGECILRMQGTRMDQSTGEIDVRMVCNNPQAAHFQKFVSAEQCSNCPVRRIKERQNPV